MAAVETGASERRLIRLTRKLSGRLSELRESVCEADGVPLSTDGTCKVCGRSRVPEPEVELERVHDGEPTEQERLQQKFRQRYAALLHERELEAQARAKAAEPVKLPKSRGERASEFLRGGQLVVRGD